MKFRILEAACRHRQWTILSRLMTYATDLSALVAVAVIQAR